MVDLFQMGQNPDEICKWVLDQRDAKIPVSVIIWEYAKTKVKADNNDTHFQASRNWAEHFMRHHNLVIRTGTSMAQKMPGDLEGKVKNFHEFVRRHREEDEYEDMYILNMDETPAYFDMAPSKSVDQVS